MEIHICSSEDFWGRFPVWDNHGQDPCARALFGSLTDQPRQFALLNNCFVMYLNVTQPMCHMIAV